MEYRSSYKHVLSAVDTETQTALCSICGLSRVRIKQDRWYCNVKPVTVEWVEQFRKTKWRAKHTLTNVDTDAKRADCSRCGPHVRIQLRPDRSAKWWCADKRTMVGPLKYRLHKGPTCAMCGLIALCRCMLDVDHIDGNHANNEVTNLRTLCSNCHRHVSHLQRAA